jgi:type IV secretion system protein VirB9
MKKILIIASLSLAVPLVAFSALPCFAVSPAIENAAPTSTTSTPVPPKEPVLAVVANEADFPALATVTPTPTKATAAPTPKERVQAAVESGGPVQRPARPFTRTPVSATPAPATAASGGLGNFLSPDTVALSAKELRALELSQDWAKSGPAPFLSGGKLTYVHGAGGIPAIIAAPMQITDVELEPGETINEIVTGDSARWLVEMGTAGDSGLNTIHLFIKPLDVGLESSLAITTDRRVYHLRLVSKPKEHTPYVGFVYSNDLRKQLAARKTDETKQKKWQSTADASGTATDLAALNFNYSITGDAPWKPERGFDDGRKTNTQLPAVVQAARGRRSW